MRKLYYAPVVHSLDAECLDGMRGILKRRSIDTALLDEFTNAYFLKLGKKMEKLYGNVDKVYRDSLTGGNERGLKEIRRLGGPTSELMLNFVKTGARIMKTESKRHMDVVCAVYQLLKEVRSDRKREFLWKLEKGVSKARNRYVARRIDETLCDGETAVLFMGAAHDIKFGRSLDVEYLCSPAYLVRESDRVVHKK